MEPTPRPLPGRAPDDGPRADPLWPAVRRVVDASQRVALDRIEIVKTDLERAVVRTATRATLLAAAAALVAVAWGCANAAAGVALARVSSTPVSLAVLALINLVVAAFIVWALLRSGARKAGRGDARTDGEAKAEPGGPAWKPPKRA